MSSSNFSSSLSSSSTSGTLKRHQTLQ
ncbi:hypothetical protein E2C01_083466 [Portunus trituberculatus]|uniref:Uncharacterized protein n=1 Tax=Portunus trituberculatus TaxID=210409 RepID=A0A5B7J3K3_PORTR|nr:hypothetical protein [Portunus trituberculatus]